VITCRNFHYFVSCDTLYRVPAELKKKSAFLLPVGRPVSPNDKNEPDLSPSFPSFPLTVLVLVIGQKSAIIWYLYLVSW